MTTWTKNFSSVVPDLVGKSLREVRCFWASVELSRHPVTLLSSMATGLCVLENLKWAFSTALESKGLFNEYQGRDFVQMNVIRACFPYHKMFWSNCSLVIFQFCVKMSPVEGICSSGSPDIDPQGKSSSKCLPQRIEGSSSHLVTFSVLPLEIGLHNISFSLETSDGNEILIKTLRVVVRKYAF